MYRLIFGFESQDSLVDFAAVTLSDGLSVYRALPQDDEVKDTENTFIVRHSGARPNTFKIWGE